MLKEKISTHRQKQRTASTISEPKQVRGAVACNACSKSIQERTHRIEQEPFTLAAEHAGIVEDRCKENSESQEHFNDELDVTEIQARSRDHHSNAGREQHHS